MISHEAFSKVMEIPNLDFEYPLEYYNTKSSIRFWVIENPKYQSTTNYINIHELSDMCKQRITGKFPMFSIKWHPNYVKGTPPACVKVWVQGELLGNKPTEPEAVFQAYQELLTKGLL